MCLAYLNVNNETAVRKFVWILVMYSVIFKTKSHKRHAIKFFVWSLKNVGDAVEVVRRVSPVVVLVVKRTRCECVFDK